MCVYMKSDEGEENGSFLCSNMCGSKLLIIASIVPGSFMRLFIRNSLVSDLDILNEGILYG